MKVNKYFYFLASIILINFAACNKEKDPFGTDDQGVYTDARDGKSYEWVRIGDQIWMAENMRYLPTVTSYKYNSGSDLCYYVLDYMGNDINEAKETSEYLDYGVLYNLPSARNCCPEGWRLPSDLEWEQLAEFISIDNGGYNKEQADWEEVGSHLKATFGWTEDGNGTDDYGFAALPGGRYLMSSEFVYLHSGGFFWTNTTSDQDKAYDRILTPGYSFLAKRSAPIKYGYSVRCIRD